MEKTLARLSWKRQLPSPYFLNLQTYAPSIGDCKMSNKTLIGRLFNQKTFSMNIKDMIDYQKEATDNFTFPGTEWMKDITEETWTEIFIIGCQEMTEHFTDTALVSAMKEVLDEKEKKEVSKKNETPEERRSRIAYEIAKAISDDGLKDITEQHPNTDVADAAADLKYERNRMHDLHVEKVSLKAELEIMEGAIRQSDLKLERLMIGVSDTMPTELVDEFAKEIGIK
jgi:hypothetical protein